MIWKVSEKQRVSGFVTVVSKRASTEFSDVTELKICLVVPPVFHYIGNTGAFMLVCSALVDALIDTRPLPFFYFFTRFLV